MISANNLRSLHANQKVGRPAPVDTIWAPSVERASHALASVIADRVAALRQLTRENLENAGFTDAEIRDHYQAALRASRAAAMVM